jgi:hypothetical protein
MASRQARKSQPAAQASESEEENSQQSSQEADMHVLKTARTMVSNVKTSVIHLYGMITDLILDQESSRIEAESH